MCLFPSLIKGEVISHSQGKEKETYYAQLYEWFLIGRERAEAAVKLLPKESRDGAKCTQEPNKTSQINFWPVGVDGRASLDLTMLGFPPVFNCLLRVNSSFSTLPG